MTAPLWPCSKCGAPGVRNVFAVGYCAAHLGDLYRQFSPGVWKLRGVGVQAGPRRPDHGPEFVELECVACAAGWVGTLLDPCPWCEEVVERMATWQGQNVLRVPDVDPDDRTYPARMSAWTTRMATAVEAGIITEVQARSAWDREVRHVA